MQMSDADIFVPNILPPSEDGVFKTLLTHPDAEPVLRDVISGVLGIPIKSVSVKNVELPISDLSEKRERLDVNCLADNDKQFDVEMQTEAMTGDTAKNKHVNIKSRAIFNLCDLHSSQKGRSVDYVDLLRSFQITFCCYAVFRKREDFVNRFSFRNSDGDELSDSVGIIFIELSKLGKVLKKPVSEMTAIEMWSVFFQYANEPKYRKVLNELANAKEEIKLASALLADISDDPVQVAHFLSRRKYQMDTDHREAVFRKKEEALRKGEETLFKKEETLFKKEETLFKKEETLRKGEEALFKKEEAMRREEEATLKAKETMRKKEEALFKDEETMRKKEEALLKAKEAMRKDEEALFKEREAMVDKSKLNGAYEKALEVARSMIARSMPQDLVSEVTGLSSKEIDELTV
jgi:predicted transposase/invertase (TIGR01784 family)